MQNNLSNGYNGFSAMEAEKAEVAPKKAPKRDLAPGELRLVQDFINAWDLPGSGRRSKPSTLADWLAERKLPGGSHLCDADVHHAVQVREALRDLAAANDGTAVTQAAMETLSRAARSAQLGIQFDHSGRPALEPRASGLDAAIGTVLAAVTRSMLNGSWSRLKVCRDDTCRWAFYDRSKNRSGCWCQMSVCGNRSKVRRHRAQRSRKATSRPHAHKDK